MILLLDTSILIDVLRNSRGRRELLAQLLRDGHTLTTSALNIAEVYAGMRPEEEMRTSAFLNALNCFDLTLTSGQLAGRLKKQWSKKGRTLTLADTMIAAIAIQQKCILMTDNRKDFPMPELECYDLPTG